MLGVVGTDREERVAEGRALVEALGLSPPTEEEAAERAERRAAYERVERSRTTGETCAECGQPFLDALPADVDRDRITPGVVRWRMKVYSPWGRWGSRRAALCCDGCVEDAFVEETFHEEVFRRIRAEGRDPYEHEHEWRTRALNREKMLAEYRRAVSGRSGRCAGCRLPVVDLVGDRYGRPRAVVTCSERCASRVRNAERSRKRREAREGRRCGWCGETFDASRSDALYCCGRCRVAAHRRRTREAS